MVYPSAGDVFGVRTAHTRTFHLKREAQTRNLIIELLPSDYAVFLCAERLFVYGASHAFENNYVYEPHHGRAAAFNDHRQIVMQTTYGD